MFFQEIQKQSYTPEELKKIAYQNFDDDPEVEFCQLKNIKISFYQFSQIIFSEHMSTIFDSERR